MSTHAASPAATPPKPTRRYHQGTYHGIPAFAHGDVIQREAREAAAAGVVLKDACPYIFGTEAEKHFTAIFLLHGGRLWA